MRLIEYYQYEVTIIQFFFLISVEWCRYMTLLEHMYLCDEAQLLMSACLCILSLSP